MFLRFSAFARCAQITRDQLNASVVKIIDDRTARDVLKKTPNAFVLFHADHMRLSDNAYFHFANVAQQTKGSSFFVIPASVGADVGRTYGITGNPSLMHFRYGTKLGVHQGILSLDSISRFVRNWTKFSVTDVTIDSFYDIAPGLSHDQNVVLLYSNASSEFGRESLKTADEVSPFMNVYRIVSPTPSISYDFPSLLIYRFEDNQIVPYVGEIDHDDMFIWIQHNIVPAFRKLTYPRLFSTDGIPQKSVVAFLNTGNQQQLDFVMPRLGRMSSSQNWIPIFYTNASQHRPFAKLLGITKVPTIAFLNANYTHIEYSLSSASDEDAFAAFYEDMTIMKIVETPSEMYGVLRPVTELAFELMIRKPTFALFSSAFCTKCKTLRQATFDAARTIKRSGYDLSIAYWDITKATPSFQQDLGLSIPSLHFFPDGNVTHTQPYNGPPNFLSIIEWMHAKVPDFDLSVIMENELGDAFNEI